MTKTGLKGALNRTTMAKKILKENVIGASFKALGHVGT
jgi:hypothetical protein